MHETGLPRSLASLSTRNSIPRFAHNNAYIASASRPAPPRLTPPTFRPLVPFENSDICRSLPQEATTCRLPFSFSAEERALYRKLSLVILNERVLVETGIETRIEGVGRDATAGDGGAVSGAGTTKAAPAAPAVRQIRNGRCVIL